MWKRTKAPPETIWYTRCPVPSATGIAVQNGWLDDAFKPLGVTVTSLRHSSDRSTRESHFTHALENAFRQGGNAPAIYARSEGRDTVLLGLQWVPQYQGIITLPESGIESVADLRGRRLALPRRLRDKIDFWRAISLQGYHNALGSAGLSLRDVVLVDLPVPESFVDADPRYADSLAAAPRLQRQHQAETGALLRGEVDAIFAYSVWGVALREQFGAREIINLAHFDRTHSVNNGQPKTLTVSGDLLREHPDLVDRYVAELVRAAEWARVHQAEARRAVAIETGSAEFWIDEGTAPNIGEQLAISLDETLVEALEVRKNFLLEHGFIQNDFDVKTWIHPGPLERALVRASQKTLTSLPFAG